MQKNNVENKQKKKGKQKNSVPQAFLGQFRTDILTYKQYKTENENKIKERKKTKQRRKNREQI